MKKYLPLLLLVVCGNVFAEVYSWIDYPYRCTADTGITADKASKLRKLYESKYKYALMWSTDEGMLGVEGNDTPQGYSDWIENIPKEGYYDVCSINLNWLEGEGIGFIYKGHNSMFMVMFFNHYEKAAIALSYEKSKYDELFNKYWELL